MHNDRCDNFKSLMVSPHVLTRPAPPEQGGAFARTSVRCRRLTNLPSSNWTLCSVGHGHGDASPSVS